MGESKLRSSLTGGGDVCVTVSNRACLLHPSLRYALTNKVTIGKYPLKSRGVPTSSICVLTTSMFAWIARYSYMEYPPNKLMEIPHTYIAGYSTSFSCL